MGYVPKTIVAILTLLTIAAPLINSVHSSLQQESVISNKGSVLVLDNFADTIFFEYGAESGVLQPPWDLVGTVGSGDESGSELTIVTTPVRTGTKSMKFYQVPPPKSDAQGRVVARYYDTQGTDLYLSWWIWLPNIYPFNATNLPVDGSVRFSFAGFTTWFGPEDAKYRYWTGLAISQSGGTQRFMITRRYSSSYGAYLTDYEYEKEWKENNFLYTDITIYDKVEQWIHFQLHYKWAQDMTGETQIWIDNTLVYNITGIKTDPRGYSNWNSLAGYFATGYNTPMINLGLHHDVDNPEACIFIDDVVVATEKVPETYEVIGN